MHPSTPPRATPPRHRSDGWGWDSVRGSPGPSTPGRAFNIVQSPGDRTAAASAAATAAAASPMVYLSSPQRSRMLASRAPAECAVTHTVELFRPGGGVTAGIMVDSLSPQRSPARNGNDGRSCVDYTGGPVQDGSGGGALCDVHGSPARLLAHSSNGAFYDPSRVRQTVSALELLEKKEVAKSGRGANAAASSSCAADDAYAAENAALRRDVERARQRLEDVEDELQER
eukprot:Rhum_TRINITY_DN13438_c0_g2::Rhum_TRINITY_DN13438_c0_g2_i1::g.60184::m.60184